MNRFTAERIAKQLVAAAQSDDKQVRDRAIQHAITDMLRESEIDEYTERQRHFTQRRQAMSIVLNGKRA